MIVTVSISKLLPLKMKTILLVHMGFSLALTGCDPIVTIEQKSGDFPVEMPSENQPDNDDAASVEFVVSIEKMANSCSRARPSIRPNLNRILPN